MQGFKSFRHDLISMAGCQELKIEEFIIRIRKILKEEYHD
jgi:hypothetical protein